MEINYMRTPAFCLQCDDGTLLENQTKNVTITIDGMSVNVPSVQGWHCPVCGEIEFTERESSQRYSTALNLLRQEVNKKNAESLRATRKKLGLRQAEAGRLFGGGVSAFSEYERGKTQPHKSTVLLLKLLNKHPELLDEVRSC
jgi:HTH-type transcriptional regulator/antitoxin MqsA